MKPRATAKSAPTGARRPARTAAAPPRPSGRPAATTTLSLGGDPAAIIERLSRGLPLAFLDELAVRFDLPAPGLARAAGIPPRTLVRRRVQGQVTPEEAQRLYRFARLLNRAVEVLGTLDAARAWFKTPRPALKGRTPFQFAESELGAHEVEQLLGRLEQGVF